VVFSPCIGGEIGTKTKLNCDESPFFIGGDAYFRLSGENL
jgi:hypothetical protein